jgi:hypothetical protein
MSAVFSECGEHRLRLDREIANDGPVAALIGVNPSTAGAEINDHTIRKDMGFARRHGWSRIIKGNLFTKRATDVRELRNCAQPNHPDADVMLETIMREANLIIPCSGPTAKLPKHLRNRWKDVVAIADRLGRDLYCFGTAKDGQPRHTLMLAYDTPLVLWRVASASTEGEAG